MVDLLCREQHKLSLLAFLDNNQAGGIVQHHTLEEGEKRSL